MTYRLAIADRTYSSWSLRGWLTFEKFGIPVEVVTARMYKPEFTRMLGTFGAARTVPAISFGDVKVWDSLAIALTLAERHPEIAFWPSEPAARGLARTMVAEMHSGFGALRSACPMNLRHCYRGFVATDPVRKDLSRIEELWSLARSHAADGPWLFGDYTLADVFFAPVAARIIGYGLPVTDDGMAYVNLHISDPAFRAWRADGIAEDYVQPGYDLDLPTVDWPGTA